MKTHLLASLLVLLTAPAYADTFGSGGNEVTIDTVPIGNSGNPANADWPFQGSVSYVFSIGKYEVTNAQYAAFLNARAAVDPRGLFSQDMECGELGGITRSGQEGSYHYATILGRDQMPVNHVSLY